LHQMAKIIVADVPATLKQFYNVKDGSPQDFPGCNVLSPLFQLYRSSNFLHRKHNANSAHDVPEDSAKVMYAQMYDQHSLNLLRSTVDILPTLEFVGNSCWMETAINALFSIPSARIKIFGDLSNEICKHMRFLFNIMCVYGPSFDNKVPKMECQRCGVYPRDARTAPPILGTEGYEGILVGDLVWGSIGYACELLLRFFNLIGLPYTTVLFDPNQKIGSDYALAIQSGFSDPVMVVSLDPTCQPPEITEVLTNGRCCAVLFGNGQHHFSVCKALRENSELWTVKDANANEFSTHKTLNAAIARARTLYRQADGFYVHAIVYFQEHT